MRAADPDRQLQSMVPNPLFVVYAFYLDVGAAATNSCYSIVFCARPIIKDTRYPTRVRGHLYIYHHLLGAQLMLYDTLQISFTEMFVSVGKLFDVTLQ